LWCWKFGKASLEENGVPSLNVLNSSVLNWQIPYGLEYNEEPIGKPVVAVLADGIKSDEFKGFEWWTSARPLLDERFGDMIYLDVAFPTLFSTQLLPLTQADSFEQNLEKSIEEVALLKSELGLFPAPPEEFSGWPIKMGLGAVLETSRKLLEWTG